MTNFKNHPQIEMVQLCSLHANPKHPIKYSPEQIDLAARVFERFGIHAPVVADDDGLLISGLPIFFAAGKLNLDAVPVIRARFLSEADRRAFILADARIAEMSEWDEGLLKAELEFLFEQDYDLSITGFDLSDLDFALVDGDRAEEAPVELPDPNSTAVTRLGDLWLIGPHKIYCGNARDTVSYDALLGEERAALVFADGPFNVKVHGHVSGLGKNRHREFFEATGEMTPPEYTAFLRSVFRNCVRYSTDGSIHYQCMDWRHIREILDAADGVYSEFKQLVVWNKTNGSNGTFYRSKHELIFVFKSGTGRHINTFGLGDKGRYRTNVWDYPGANTFRKGRDADLAVHPTVKNLALVCDALLDCSHRGDLILDPFSGSGTTLCAAYRTKRRGAAIEIDPLYVDTSLRRLQAASGLTPTLADGRTFAEVATDRSNEEAVNG